MKARRPVSPDPPLTSLQQVTRVAQISAANAEMCDAKTAAFAEYGRVHPVGHARCTDRCDEAHRALCDRLADINAAYQAALPRMD